MALAALLKRGAGDSIVQVGATTLVRLGLVVSVLALAPFVGLEELGDFDLFVVGATLVQVAVTMGMDSGLAIVGQRQHPRIRAWFLVSALLVMTALSALLGAALAVWSLIGFDLPGDALLAPIALGYGSQLAAMMLIFSWFRWQGQARTASLLLIGANVASFVSGALAVSVFGTIVAFASGLLAGSIGGVAICLVYLSRRQEFGRSSLRELRRRRVIALLVRELLGISVPYFLASAALLLRRVVDRAYVLSLGDPKLIGAYAIVARAAEIVGFALGVPSVGFAPIFVAEHGDESVRRLGRIMYLAYVATSTVIVVGVLVGTTWLLDDIDDPAVASMIPLATAIVAGTLFLGETSIAAFGYIIARRPAVFTSFSLGFILLYAAGVVGFSLVSSGATPLGCSFAVGSFLFSTASVVWSERLASFRYPLGVISLLKSVTLFAAMLPLVA